MRAPMTTAAEYSAAVETAVAAVGCAYEQLDVPASLFLDGSVPPQHVLWAVCDLAGRLLRGQPEGVARSLLRTWGALACELPDAPTGRFEVPDVWPPRGDGSPESAH